VLIPVQKADVSGAGAVRLVNDIARQCGVLDILRQHKDILTFSDVRTDSDSKSGEHATASRSELR
jgi:hypothetical protein